MCLPGNGEKVSLKVLKDFFSNFWHLTNPYSFNDDKSYKILIRKKAKVTAGLFNSCTATDG